MRLSKNVFKEQLIHFPSKPTVADLSGRRQQPSNCVQAAIVLINKGLKNEFAFFVSVPHRTAMAKCRCSVSVPKILSQKKANSPDSSPRLNVVFVFFCSLARRHIERIGETDRPWSV